MGEAAGPNTGAEAARRESSFCDKLFPRSAILYRRFLLMLHLTSDGQIATALQALGPAVTWEDILAPFWTCRSAS